MSNRLYSSIANAGSRPAFKPCAPSEEGLDQSIWDAFWASRNVTTEDLPPPPVNGKEEQEKHYAILPRLDTPQRVRTSSGLTLEFLPRRERSLRPLILLTVLLWSAVAGLAALLYTLTER